MIIRHYYMRSGQYDTHFKFNGEEGQRITKRCEFSDGDETYKIQCSECGA